jgi:hypothetical protein
MLFSKMFSHCIVRIMSRILLVFNNKRRLSFIALHAEIMFVCVPSHDIVGLHTVRYIYIYIYIYIYEKEIRFNQPFPH